MNSKRAKKIRNGLIELGFDLSTLQINGRGKPNLFRKVKRAISRREAIPNDVLTEYITKKETTEIPAQKVIMA